MNKKQIIEFVIESNSIEGINRDPTAEEINEFERFINLEIMNSNELEKFVSVYQPDARLRDEYGLNVRVNNYYPPFGGPDMRKDLEDILVRHENAFVLHLRYELLHPFTDGNGRSGRALWAWKMKKFEGAFLLNFYFQSLQHLKPVSSC